MIDIHTHILPHFDDGAKDLDTAVAMLQSCVEQGVKTVVLTPHYYGKRFSPSQFLKQREDAFERLKPHIPDKLTVLQGTEVHFTGINLPPYEELCKLSIEGTKYILLEFSFTTAWTGMLADRLADFINETGYTPIIAHVERYVEVLQEPSIVSDLVQMGCLIQVNAGSFVEKQSRNLTRALLKRGLVHCIGTDAHDMEDRAPNVEAVKKALEKAGLLPQWERAQKIMSGIISGQQVCVEVGKRVKKLFGKYF